MKKGIIIAFFLLFFAELVNAFSIVVDISPGQINIDSDFKGQRVLVFGGVHSSLSFALTSASFPIRYSTISLWPYRAAKCSGVHSSLSFHPCFVKVFK